MPVITYDTIEPNLAEVEVAGAMVQVTWKCPVTNKIVTKSESKMVPPQTTSTTVQSAVKRAAIWEFFKYLGYSISHLLPGGAGRIAKTAVFSTSFGVTNTALKPKFNEMSERAAMVKAFEMIKDQFRWDEDRELYVAK